MKQKIQKHKTRIKNNIAAYTLGGIVALSGVIVLLLVAIHANINRGDRKYIN